MILNKVKGYEKKIRVVNTRLKGAFYRTLGDSTLPVSIEDGQAIVTAAQDSIRSDSTLSKGHLHKKERQLRSLERQVKNELGLITS